MRSVSMTRSLRRRYSAVREGGQGSAEPLEIGAKAMEAVRSLEAAVRNSPAYGARNVSMVAAGTGEALPGPVDLRILSPERGVL